MEVKRARTRPLYYGACVVAALAVTALCGGCHGKSDDPAPSTSASPPSAQSGGKVPAAIRDEFKNAPH